MPAGSGIFVVIVGGNWAPSAGLIVPGGALPSGSVRMMGGSEYEFVRSSYVNQYPPGIPLPLVWKPDMSSMRRAFWGQEAPPPPLPLPLPPLELLGPLPDEPELHAERP
jgi:hypothetical protein